MAKTVVGLFDNRTEAQKVVQELVADGFPRDDISLIANDTPGAHGEEAASDPAGGAAKGGGTGAVLGGVAGLIVGVASLAVPGVGPVLAAGPLATALAGAGMGAVAGGIIGALTKMGLPEEEAHYYAEGVRRGGTLVTVKTSGVRADRAAAIMDRHGAVNLQTRAAEWKQAGWTGFNPQAEPYTAIDITRERERYAGIASSAAPPARGHDSDRTRRGERRPA